MLFGCIAVFMASCSNNTQTTIKSYSDGPYIVNRGDSVSILFQRPDFTFDSLTVGSSGVNALNFKCLFDSIDVPSLTFRMVPKSDNVEHTFSMPTRLLAMSDIEGDYKRYYKLLLSNGVIDSAYNWTFGEGHLVVLGDLVDRGDYVTQCLWLTYYLEEEAKKYGGAVHYLPGNHEQLVLLGYDVYAAPKYQRNFERLGLGIPELFATNTVLGSWISGKNAIIKIGDLLFVHGGVSPSILKYGMTLGQMNAEIKRDIATQEFQTDESAALLTSEGLLWYRGLIEADDEYEKITEPELDVILDKFDCKSIIIGHTPVDSLSADFSGKVIRLCVMNYADNSALYIENGRPFAVDDKGSKIDIESD